MKLLDGAQRITLGRQKAYLIDQKTFERIEEIIRDYEDAKELNRPKKEKRKMVSGEKLKQLLRKG